MEKNVRIRVDAWPVTRLVKAPVAGGTFAANLILGEKRQLLLSGPLGSQRARTHRVITHARKKDIGPELQERFAYVFDLDHSRAPTTGHESSQKYRDASPRLAPQDPKTSPAT